MGLAKIGLGEVYREWNQLEKAAALSEEGLSLIQRWGEIGGLDGYISSARIKQAQGDEAGALTAMSKAAEIAARFDASQIDDYMVRVFPRHVGYRARTIGNGSTLAGKAPITGQRVTENTPTTCGNQAV